MNRLTFGHDWNRPAAGRWPQVVDESFLARPEVLGALNDDPGDLAAMGLSHLALDRPPSGPLLAGLTAIWVDHAADGPGERHTRFPALPDQGWWVPLDALEAALDRIAAGGRPPAVWVLDDTAGEGPSAAHRAVPKARAALGPAVQLGWRGSDRQGLAVAGALAAAELGVDRVHGAAFDWGTSTGVGPLDQILLNLALDRPETAPPRIDRLADRFVGLAEAAGHRIPPDYPLLGTDAFRTATGVHAAAIVKALERGESEVADAVYSAVPARRFGRTQRVEVGPMSGLANVRWWCAERGVRFDVDRAQRLLEWAKASGRNLTEAELWAAMAQPPTRG